MTRGRPRGSLWRLVAWVLPPTPAGRSILGDLIEEFHGRPPGIRRRVWLLKAATQLCVAYLPDRLASGRTRAPVLRGIAGDVRAAVRSFRRDQRPAALAVAALAIGIGSVTSILSVAYGSLLRPLPFPDPETLVVLGDRTADGPLDRIAGNIALQNVRDVARAAPAVRAWAAYRDTGFTVSGAGDTQRVRAQEVEPGFFRVLGVAILVGRSFADGDEAEAVVVLSEFFWRREFGADPGVLGRTVQLDAAPHVVIGIASRTTQLGNPALWRPLQPSAVMRRRNARQVYAVARLAAGVPPHAAAAQLAARFDDLRRAYPEIGPDRSIAVTTMRAWLLGREGPRLLYVLAAVVAAVLLIAALNAALLMVARTEHRRHELSLRAALGATRLRLLRLILCEALVLAVAGAAAGLLFAMWSTRLLVQLYGAVLPRSWEIELQPPVIAAAMGLAGATALVIALFPMVRFRGPGLRRLEGLSRSQPLVGFTQRALIAAQVALAIIFLIAGGLVVRSVAKLTRQDLGVRTAGVVLFDMSLRGRHADAAAARPMLDALLGRFRALPGVVAAAASTRRPLMGGGNSGFMLPDHPPDRAQGFLEIRDVTPAYFSTLGMTLASGRLLTDVDAASGSPVLVNQAFAQRYLPQGAVGQRLRVSNSDRTYAIVGVVSDIREFGPEHPARPTAYWPFGNGPYPGMLGLTVALEVQGRDPLSIVPDARAILAATDPYVALDDSITLEELALNRAGRDRLAMRTLLMLASAMAVTLTALGVYGVISFSVAARRREIGIRRALGCTSGGIVSLFVRQGVAHAAPGLVLGLLLARPAARGVASYLYEVEPNDPATFAATALGVGALAAVASWIPAHRAGSTEASVTLLRE